MSTPDFLAALARRLPSLTCLREKEDFIPYSFDGTAALRQMPAAVFPTTTEEVAAVMRKVSRHTGSGGS